MIGSEDGGRRKYQLERRHQSDAVTKILVIVVFFIPAIFFLVYVAWWSLGWGSLLGLVIVLSALRLVYALALQASVEHQPDGAIKQRIAVDLGKDTPSQTGAVPNEGQSASTGPLQRSLIDIIGSSKLRTFPTGATVGAAVIAFAALNEWPNWVVIGSVIAAAAIVATLYVSIEQHILHSVRANSPPASLSPDRTTSIRPDS
jgi:hypothetical protein